MRKIILSLVLLNLVLIPCFSNGQNEQKEPIDNSVEDFNGTWQQVGGASVITFKDGEFEVVNLEEGFAGWGIISLTNWGKDVALRIDTHNDYEGRKTKGYLLNLNIPVNKLNLVKKNRTYTTKDFQIKAWEEFKVPMSERNGKFYNDHGHPNQNNELQTFTTGQPYRFELNENNLKLTMFVDNSHLFFLMCQTLFAGDFIRVE